VIGDLERMLKGETVTFFQMPFQRLDGGSHKVSVRILDTPVEIRTGNLANGDVLL
jgi:hypothetical protein